MRNIFALRGREQRVAIAIAIFLVVAALANHYLTTRTDLPPARSTSTLPSATPDLSEESQTTAEDDAP